MLWLAVERRKHVSVGFKRVFSDWGQSDRFILGICLNYLQYKQSSPQLCCWPLLFFTEY